MKMTIYCILLICVFLTAIKCYVVDLSPGLGRTYDGIGGLSGGGATSKLLVNYPDEQRSQILDFLFKPNYGASLQIFKVEIGGDSQSTDGTESSHMHEYWDENYQRGYEWQLMVEAKKRNPSIKLYGLPWAFPGWLSNGTDNPYVNVNATADYIVRWVKGAKAHYDLHLDYIGVWNERKYNVAYVKVLRQMLDASGFANVKLVVADGGWGVTDDMDKDPVFAKAVDVIGAHYPGTNSTPAAVKTGKQLSSSEDYSTFNDNVGAGCWARILNQNYVNGYMSSTISWNLIASYYQDLAYGRDGLMTAQEPWSGHYVVESPIWVTAHTTQFTDVGWKYLQHGSGVGHLDEGGSYVSLISNKDKQFTMIIETMTHNHSVCIRPALPAYTVTPQNATFQLKGELKIVKTLVTWTTKLDYNGRASKLFEKSDVITVTDGSFTIALDVDMVVTLTTLTMGHKGTVPSIPPSAPFPLPYEDDYNSYDEFNEAFNFVPQTGVWEVRDSHDPKHKMVNRQVVLNKPVYWCDTGNVPLNIGGNYNWTDTFLQTDVNIPSVNGTSGAFVGARVTKGSCQAGTAMGIFYFILINNTYVLAGDIEMKLIITKGQLPRHMKLDTWHHISLIVRDSKAYGFLGTDTVFQSDIPPISAPHGFAAYGTTSFGIADFDNLKIDKSGDLKKIDPVIKYLNIVGL